MILQTCSGKTAAAASAVSRPGVLGQDGKVERALDLQAQNRRFQGSGGISQENRSSGFLPAFRDTHAGAVYLSRFANGRLAPMHLLEGLPSGLVVKNPLSQQVVAVKESVTAGFVRDDRFYTRQEAAQATLA